MAKKTKQEVKDVEAYYELKASSRYHQIIEAVFQRYWKKGKTEFVFAPEHVNGRETHLFTSLTSNWV